MHAIHTHTIITSNHKRSLEQELMLLYDAAKTFGIRAAEQFRRTIEEMQGKISTIQNLSRMIQQRADQQNPLSLDNNLDMEELITKARDLGINLAVPADKRLFSYDELIQLQQTLVHELTTLQKNIEQEQMRAKQEMKQHDELLQIVIGILQKLSAIISKIIANIAPSSRS